MSYLLKLVSMTCIDQQELWSDEVFINVGNQRATSFGSFNNGDIVKFNNGEGIITSFNNSANVQVFEEDWGVLDRHDFINQLTINGAAYAGKGEQTVDIIGDGAHYQLTFAVAAQPVF